MSQVRPRTVRRMMVLIASLSLLFAGLTCSFRAYDAARYGARAAFCTNNLKQIGLALLNYESVYGSLPPAYTTDPAGRPLLSWRVLILPFLEEQTLHDAFVRDEPWDGPNNILLLDKMPGSYSCPTHQHDAWTDASRFTNYLATAGPGTAFPGSSPVKIDAFRDGTDVTLLVVETDQADVPWSAPVDLDARTGGLINFNAPQPVSRGPTTPHSSGLNSLAADGSVFRLAPEKLRQSLGSVSTIAGGEPTRLDDLEPGLR